MCSELFLVNLEINLNLKMLLFLILKFFLYFLYCLVGLLMDSWIGLLVWGGRLVR